MEQIKHCKAYLGFGQEFSILTLLQEETSASKPCQLFLLTACKSLTLEELGQLARLLQLQLETHRLWTLFCFDVNPQILQAPIWRGGGGEKNKE